MLAVSAFDTVHCGGALQPGNLGRTAAAGATLQTDKKGGPRASLSPRELQKHFLWRSSGACQRALCSTCAFRAALMSLQEKVPVEGLLWHLPVQLLSHASKQLLHCRGLGLSDILVYDPDLFGKSSGTCQCRRCLRRCSLYLSMAARWSGVVGARSSLLSSAPRAWSTSASGLPAHFLHRHQKSPSASASAGMCRRRQYACTPRSRQAMLYLLCLAGAQGMSHSWTATASGSPAPCKGSSVHSGRVQVHARSPASCTGTLGLTGRACQCQRGAWQASDARQP